MKEIYKNPLLYYVLVPMVLVFWPAAVWLVYIPNVEKKLKTTETSYNKTQELIGSILTIDTGRLESDGGKGAEIQFDYVAAVDRITKSNNISSSSYNINTKPERMSKGQKSQGAKMILWDIDITRFAKFMSDIQLRWGNLQCEKVVMTKQEGVADSWRIEVDFEYYY